MRKFVRVGFLMSAAALVLINGLYIFFAYHCFSMQSPLPVRHLFLQQKRWPWGQMRSGQTIFTLLNDWTRRHMQSASRVIFVMSTLT